MFDYYDAFGLILSCYDTLGLGFTVLNYYDVFSLSFLANMIHWALGLQC